MVSAQRASTENVSPLQQDDERPMTLGLWLIVLLKALTALCLWATFVLLVFAQQTNPQDFFSVLVRRAFRGNPPGLAIRWLATNTEFITPTMIARVALATVAYAAVESTEAIGLLLRKAWAEWLVILVTISFIPFEVYEIIMRPHPLKGLTLAVNILVLWYLLKRLREKRRHHRAPAGALATHPQTPTP
jgi:uncharacterized membrane protein (DUF2068 family)